jgi:glycosyltransferase involved in cell wall biosynthesis
MRIVHVISRYNVGGTAKWLRVLVDGLIEQGHDVSLIIGDTSGDEKEDINLPNCQIIRIPGLGKSASLLKTISAFFKLKSVISELHPEIINSHTSKAGVLVRILKFFHTPHEVRYVHTYHGHLLYGYFNPIIVRLIILIEKMLSGKSFSLISAGLKVKDDLIAAGIGTHTKFEVIPFGMSDMQFLSRSECRKNLGLSQDQFVVGWLGRMAPIKRPDVLLEIARHFPNIQFLIGGDGELIDEVLHNRTLNVQVLGWTSPEGFWPACDLAILTSDNEAMPISLLEAGLCGLPVVASRVGSIEDLITNTESGFLCETVTEFVASIKLLVDDLDLRMRIAQKFNRDIKDNYGTAKFVNRHIIFYESLIN